MVRWVALFVSLLPSCLFFTDEPNENFGYVDEVWSEPPREVTIDDGSALGFTPGDGVGVFVTHRGAGHWTVQTSCDSRQSGASCIFELVAQADSAAQFIDAQDTPALALPDHVLERLDGVSAYFETSLEADELGLALTPDAPLTLSVTLDGTPAPEFIYWIGDGLTHQGAPSTPITFVPAR